MIAAVTTVTFSLFCHETLAAADETEEGRGKLVLLRDSLKAVCSERAIVTEGTDIFCWITDKHNHFMPQQRDIPDTLFVCCLIVLETRNLNSRPEEKRQANEAKGEERRWDERRSRRGT